MKQIMKSRAEVGSQEFITTILFVVMLLLSDSEAVCKTTTQNVSSSPVMVVGDSSEIVFDGYGTLDVILNSFRPQSAKDDKIREIPVSVIIDGDQHELSAEVLFYHYLMHPVTINDLKPDDYVGFKKDPLGRIIELWILKPDKQKTKQQDLRNQAPVPPPEPPADLRKIRKEGDVWKN
jgi:hypothetical protein